MNHAAARPRDAAFANSSSEMARHDGRNRRSAETRRKIIEAAKAMISETGTAPTVVGVAKRADVSVRSVFQHFGDVESLFVTVFDNVRDNVARPQQPAGEAALPVRIDWVIDHLAEIYDQVVPLRIAAGQFADTNQALVERRESARKEITGFVHEAFAPEFANLDQPAKAELLAAFDATLSIDSWIALRRGSGLAYEPAKGVWRRMVTALFDHAKLDGERVQLAHD
jgi:AcrR family transcriptional regulator